ncbi:MAG: hypothetical protein DHS20C11_06790 [Lysobacteraceae bacterium]|nr:MAG: hypothetical protein DHS20C11_06790 [Xanthomonadaceae bacterium]
MIDEKTIEGLVQRLGALVPPGLEQVRGEMKSNLRAAVGGWLSELDLVTREEFDVQKALLVRAQQKLKSLEARLQELADAAESDQA